MPGVMRLRQLALIALLVGMGVQDADAGDETMRLLRSDTPRDVAWGAWQARGGGAGLRELVVARLARAAEPDSKLAAAVPWLLDAAIHLKSVPPVELVRRLIHMEANATTVWLCTAPQPNDDAVRAAFIEVDREIDKYSGTSGRWVALGNVLCSRWGRGTAPLLLRELAFKATVIVRDDEQRRWRGPSGSVTGHGRQSRVAGYPPIPHYFLTGSSRHPLLADGAHPVHVHYEVQRRSVDSFGIYWNDAPCRTAVRIGWMKQRLGVHLPPPLFIEDRWHIDYVGDQPYQRELDRLVRGHHDRVSLWIEGLRRAGLTDRDEARRIKIRIQLDIKDLRRFKRRDLPAGRAPLSAPPRLPHPNLARGSENC